MEADDALSVFVKERPRLFGIAYRMLGSAVEAEDIVQDVWLRWQDADHAKIVNAPAFLTTATTRLAMNVAQSARSRREGYIGPWLPEPVDTRNDPRLGAECGEALEFAVLMLLERLTPTERAAYILREAFNLPYEQIAEILRLSEVNVRQVVARARKHIDDERRAPVSSAERQRLLVTFVDAAQTGHLAQLEDLFAEDIVSYSDGGGIRGVARKPVHGRATVVKFVAGIASRLWTDTAITWIQANGQPCILLSRHGRVFGLGTISVSERGIEHIMWMMNPAKLGAVVASARAT